MIIKSFCNFHATRKIDQKRSLSITDLLHATGPDCGNSDEDMESVPAYRSGKIYMLLFLDGGIYVSTIKIYSHLLGPEMDR